MSFDIFAAGTDGFTYGPLTGRPDSTIFTAASIMSSIWAMSGPTAGGVIEGAGEYTTPSPRTLSGGAVSAVASMSFLSTLKTSVDMLAVEGKAGGGWIDVHSRLTRMLGSDIARHIRYDFTPGHSPGAEFVRKITSALIDTEMNNYGVLREISNALSLYSHALTPNTPPRIQIQLSR